ncbi:MAG: hypothetical protein M1814_005715 [Vezdaea aestivalis]|nr:MAG: hypothetical protein M1814_005715 [Vezdaea aestivalis]
MKLYAVTAILPLVAADLQINVQPKCTSVPVRELGDPGIEHYINERDFNYDNLCWAQPGVMEHDRKGVLCFCNSRTAMDRPGFQYQRFQCGSWPTSITDSIFKSKSRFPYSDPPDIKNATTEDIAQYTVLKTCYLACGCPRRPPLGHEDGELPHYDYLSRPKSIIRTDFYSSAGSHRITPDESRYTLADDLQAIATTEIADERLRKTDCSESCTGYQGPEACAGKRHYPGCEKAYCRVKNRIKGIFFSIGVCTLPIRGSRPVDGTPGFSSVIEPENPRRSVDEVSGCACNATYVSELCCGSADGFVWELPEMKLGQLELEGL